MDNNNDIDNEIVAEINIDENNIDKEIRIINSFEKSKRENRIIIDDCKNEEEINKCKIKIDNEIIPFSYFYKFNKKGKYNIKYSFINKIININNMFMNVNF